MREKKTDYRNESQQNLMRIVEFLATDIVRPSTVQEIVDALEIPYSKVNWTLHNLLQNGWAEQKANGWRLSPRISRIADSVRTSLDATVRQYLVNGQA